MRKKTHDTTTKEGVKEQAKDAEHARLRKLADLKTMLSLPAGRRYIRSQLEDGFMYTTTYDKVNSKFAQNEGKRAVVLKLMEDMSELVVRGMMKPVELVHFIINLPEED